MKLFDKIALKFIIVGIINTVVGTSVMFFMYNIVHTSYWISSSLNYIVGSVVSYFLNKYFTFQNKEKSIKEIVLFIVNITFCFILAYGVAKPLVYKLLILQKASIQDNVAMIVGMCLFVVFNYLGQRYIVFNQKK